jgi:hypothetical protein
MNTLSTPYTFGNSSTLKAVTLFTPRTNARDSVMLDTATGKIIGFDNDRPFISACDAQTVITEGGGIVSGALVFGFDCYHCHDDIYRLGVL